MKNKPTTYPSRSLAATLGRFNVTIFIVIVVGILVFCILILNGIMNKPPDINNDSNTSTTKFDQTTINRLNKFKTSSENSSNQVLPSGRINPFSE